MLPNLTRRQFSAGLTAAWFYSQFLAKQGYAVTPPANTSTHVVQANNEFAFSLLKQLIQEKPRANQFLSPFSIESALTIALEGARKQTASEMGQALGLPAEMKQADGAAWDMERVRTEYANLFRGLTPPADSATAAKRSELTELRKKFRAADDDAKRLNAESKFNEVEKAGQKAKALADKINSIAANIDQYELATANSLWVEKSYPLSREFQRNISQFYGSADAQLCNFKGKPEEERKRINAWVAQNTKDKIQNILAEGSLELDTRLVIANAIYFKGNWTKPFDAARTAPADFTKASGDTTSVQMMHAPAMKEGRYAAFGQDGQLFETPSMVERNFDSAKGYPGNDGFQMLELPYVGDRLAMVILLPRSATGIDALANSLTGDHFKRLRGALANRSVHVKVPKFKLETTYDLIPALKNLGMQQAFSDTQANFEGLIDSQSFAEKLYISLVIHKAFVEVNEKGTEAAAATVVGMRPLAAPATRPFIPEFTADHPFLAAIVDKQTDMILFLGKVEAPQSN